MIETQLSIPSDDCKVILLVEDELIVRRTLSFYLKRFGFEIIEACNGGEAIELWKENQERIGMLFTDLEMPEGLSGLDLAQRFLSDKPNLQVVVSSGYDIESQVENKDYAKKIILMSKPCCPDTLLKVLREALNITDPNPSRSPCGLESP